MNRDNEPGRNGLDFSPGVEGSFDETLPGASSTAGKFRIPVEAEPPSDDVLQAFAREEDLQVSLEELCAQATLGTDAGIRAVEELAAIPDDRVPDLLIKIHRGTRDHYGRIRESAAVRDAAARALARNPKAFGLMVSKLCNGKPLEKNEALHVVARRNGPEGTKALVYAARRNVFHPTGPESVDLARLAIQYLGEREEPEALATLLELAKKGVPETRAAVVTTLGRRQEPEAIQMVRDRAHNDPDRMVVIAATRAIG